MKQAQAQTAHPPSIKAMPPLPASVLSAKQSSSDSSLAAFQQSFGSTANPLLDILERIYSELILDITVDIAVQVHKEAHARVGNAAPLLDLDVFGQVIQKKNPERSFKCESCGQKTGSSKYAAHLEKCTGKGGRTSRRSRHPTAAAAASSAATASSAASAAASSASVVPVLAALNREDDIELIEVTSRNGGSAKFIPSASRVSPATASSRLTGGPSPIAAGTTGGASRGSSPMRHGDRSVTPLGGLRGGPSPLAGGGVSESPFASGAVDSASASISPSLSDWTQQESESAPPLLISSTAGGSNKRARLLGSDGVATTATSAAGSKPTRRHTAEELWTDVLPLPYPTQVLNSHQAILSLGLGVGLGLLGGSSANAAAATTKGKGGNAGSSAGAVGVPLPFYLSAADLAAVGAGSTVPDPAALNEMFGRICGAPSVITGKLCSNKPSCSMHSDADRAKVRQAVSQGDGGIRFKKVKPTPAAAAAVAAATAAAASGTAGSKKRGAAAAFDN